eukprot:1844021-Pleurochrysis_carterae.AAC.1
MEADVIVVGDKTLLEGEDALAVAVVRVDLRLRESPVVQHLRTRARGTAPAILADLFAVRLRLAAQ